MSTKTKFSDQEVNTAKSTTSSVDGPMKDGTEKNNKKERIAGNESQDIEMSTKTKFKDYEKYYPEPNPFELFPNPWTNPFLMASLMPCGCPKYQHQIINTGMPCGECMNRAVFYPPNMGNPPYIPPQPYVPDHAPPYIPPPMPSYSTWQQPYYAPIPQQSAPFNIDGFSAPAPCYACDKSIPAILPPLPPPSNDRVKTKSKSTHKKKKRRRERDEDDYDNSSERWTCWSHPNMRNKKWWLVWNKNQKRENGRTFEDPFRKFAKRDSCNLECDIICCDSHTDNCQEVSRNLPRPLGHMTATHSKKQCPQNIKPCTVDIKDQHKHHVECQCQCSTCVQPSCSPGAVKSCQVCQCRCSKANSPCQTERMMHCSNCLKTVCDKDAQDQVTEVSATLVRSIQVSLKSKRKNRGPKTMKFNVDVASAKMLSSLLTKNTDCSTAKQICDRIGRSITQPTSDATQCSLGRPQCEKQSSKCLPSRSLECERKLATCPEPCISNKKIDGLCKTSTEDKSKCDPFPTRPRHLDKLMRCFDQELCGLPCHCDHECVQCCSSTSDSNSSPENDSSSANEDLANCDSFANMRQVDPCQGHEKPEKQKDSCKTRAKRKDRCCTCCKKKICCKKKKCNCRSIERNCACTPPCHVRKSKTVLRCPPKCCKQLNLCYSDVDKDKCCPKNEPDCCPSSLQIVSQGPYSSVNVHYSQCSNPVQKSPVWSVPVPPCVNHKQQTSCCQKPCQPKCISKCPQRKNICCPLPEKKESPMLCGPSKETSERSLCPKKSTYAKCADDQREDKRGDTCCRKDAMEKNPCPDEETKCENVCIERQPKCYKSKAESSCEDDPQDRVGEDLEICEPVEKKKCGVCPENNICKSKIRPCEKTQEKCNSEKESSSDNNEAQSRDVDTPEPKCEKRYGCNESKVCERKECPQMKKEQHYTGKEGPCQGLNALEPNVVEKKVYGPCNENSVYEKKNAPYTKHENYRKETESPCEIFDTFEPETEIQIDSGPCDEHGVCELKKSPLKKDEKCFKETEIQMDSGPCDEHGVCELKKSPLKKDEKCFKETEIQMDSGPCDEHGVCELKKSPLKKDEKCFKETEIQMDSGPCDEHGVCELKKSPLKKDEKGFKDSQNPFDIFDTVESEPEENKYSCPCDENGVCELKRSPKVETETKAIEKSVTSEHFGATWGDWDTSDSDTEPPKKKEYKPCVENNEHERETTNDDVTVFQLSDSEKSLAISKACEEELQISDSDSYFEESDRSIEFESDEEICGEIGSSEKEQTFQNRPCFEDHSNLKSARHNLTSLTELAYTEGIEKTDEGKSLFRKKNQNNLRATHCDFYQSLKKRKNKEVTDEVSSSSGKANVKKHNVKNSAIQNERPCFEHHRKGRKITEHKNIFPFPKNSASRDLDIFPSQDHDKSTSEDKLRKTNAKTSSKDNEGGHKSEHYFPYDEHHIHDNDLTRNEVPCFHEEALIEGNKFCKSRDNPCFHEDRTIKCKENNLVFGGRNVDGPCFHECRSITTKGGNTAELRDRRVESPSPCFHEDRTAKSTKDDIGAISKEADSPGPCCHENRTIKTKKDDTDACVDKINRKIDNPGPCFHEDRTVKTIIEQFENLAETRDSKIDHKETGIYFPFDEHHIHDERISMKEMPCFHDESPTVENAYRKSRESPCFHEDRAIKNKENNTGHGNRKTDHPRPCFHEHRTIKTEEGNEENSALAKSRKLTHTSPCFHETHTIKTKKDIAESESHIIGRRIDTNSPCLREHRPSRSNEKVKSSERSPKVPCRHEDMSITSQTNKINQSSSDGSLMSSGSNTDNAKKCGSRSSQDAASNTLGSKRYRKNPNCHKNQSVSVGKVGKGISEHCREPRNSRRDSRGPCFHACRSLSSHPTKGVDSNNECKKPQNSRIGSQSPCFHNVRSICGQKAKAEESNSVRCKENKSKGKQSPCLHEHFTVRSHKSKSHKNDSESCEKTSSKRSKQSPCFHRHQSQSSHQSKVKQSVTEIDHERPHHHRNRSVGKHNGNADKINSEYIKQPKSSKTERNIPCFHDNRIIRSQKDTLNEIYPEAEKIHGKCNTDIYKSCYHKGNSVKTERSTANGAKVNSHLLPSVSTTSSGKGSRNSKRQIIHNPGCQVTSSDSANSKSDRKLSGPHLHYDHQMATSIHSPHIHEAPGSRKEKSEGKAKSSIKYSNQSGLDSSSKKICSRKEIKNPCFHNLITSMNRDTESKGNDKSYREKSSPLTQNYNDIIISKCGSSSFSKCKRRNSEQCKLTKGSIKCKSTSMEKTKSFNTEMQRAPDKCSVGSGGLGKNPCEIECQSDFPCQTSSTSRLENVPQVCCVQPAFKVHDQKEKLQNVSKSKGSSRTRDQKNEQSLHWMSLYSGGLAASTQRSATDLVSDEDIADTSSDIGTYECLPSDGSCKHSSTNEKVSDEEEKVSDENPDNCLNQSMSNRSSNIGKCVACKLKMCTRSTKDAGLSKDVFTEEYQIRDKSKDGKYPFPKRRWGGSRKMGDNLFTVDENEATAKHCTENLWDSESRKICEMLYAVGNDAKVKYYKDIPKHKPGCATLSKDVCGRNAKKDGRQVNICQKSVKSTKDKGCLLHDKYHRPTCESDRFWEPNERLKYCRLLSDIEKLQTESVMDIRDKEEKCRPENVHVAADDKFQTMKPLKGVTNTAGMKKLKRSTNRSKEVRQKDDKESVLNVISILIPKDQQSSLSSHRAEKDFPEILKFESAVERKTRQEKSVETSDSEEGNKLMGTNSDWCSCDSEREYCRHTEKFPGTAKKRKNLPKCTDNTSFKKQKVLYMDKYEVKTDGNTARVSASGYCYKSSACLDSDTTDTPVCSQSLSQSCSRCNDFPKTKVRRCKSPCASYVSTHVSKNAPRQNHYSGVKKGKHITKHNQMSSSASSGHLSLTAKERNKKQRNISQKGRPSSSGSDSKRRHSQGVKPGQHSRHSRSTSKKSPKNRSTSASNSEESLSHGSSGSKKSSSSAREMPRPVGYNKLCKSPSISDMPSKGKNTIWKSKLNQQRKHLLQVDSSIDHEIVKALCTLYQNPSGIHNVGLDLRNIGKTHLNKYDRLMNKEALSRSFTLSDFKRSQMKDNLKNSCCQKTIWDNSNRFVSQKFGFMRYKRSFSAPRYIDRQTNNELPKKSVTSSWTYKNRLAKKDVYNSSGKYSSKQLSLLSDDTDFAIPKYCRPFPTKRSSFLYTSSCKMYSGATIETTYCGQKTKSSGNCLRFSNLGSKSKFGCDMARPYSELDYNRDLTDADEGKQFPTLKCLPVLPACLTPSFFHGVHQKHEASGGQDEPAHDLAMVQSPSHTGTEEAAKTNIPTEDQISASEQKIQNCLPKPEEELPESINGKVGKGNQDLQQGDCIPLPMKIPCTNSIDIEGSLPNQDTSTKVTTIESRVNNEDPNEYSMTDSQNC